MTDETLTGPPADATGRRHRHDGRAGPPATTFWGPTWRKVLLAVLLTLTVATAGGYFAFKAVVPGNFLLDDPPPGAAPSVGAPPAGPSGDATGPPAGAELIGPPDLDGLQRMLDGFCRQRGQRTALLLAGPDGTTTTGDWVCTRVVSFTLINLDEPCQEVFGAGIEARKTDQDDSRTWRCFDT